MINTSFKIKKLKIFIRIAAACFLILVNGINLFAQYKGAPVKRDRLIKALRSKQLQTRDIVTVINSNGVNFKLTPEIKKSLIAAGARPEIIKAVADNSRPVTDNETTVAKSKKRKTIRANKPGAPHYDDLLEQAMFAYKDRQNPRDAARFLEAALKLNPQDPLAYQMLGFINLYGLNNSAQAVKYMRQAISNGGSAVFRVFHDDRGSFTKRCAGSLFVSPESVRFESDDNIHTFETSTVNVDKIKLDRESSATWKNHTIFKVYLKIGKDKVRFRFAPITGRKEESQLVSQFVAESQASGGSAGLTANLLD